jgi:anti-sigma B factor antagonist
MNMTMTTRQVGSVTIVDINGRIVLEECGLLRGLLSNLLAAGHNKILLNLADTSRIDTAGLAYLISGLVSARKQHGELKLLNPTKTMRDVIRLTKLDTVFDMTKQRPSGPFRSIQPRQAPDCRIIT